MKRQLFGNIANVQAQNINKMAELYILAKNSQYKLLKSFWNQAVCISLSGFQDDKLRCTELDRQARRSQPGRS